MKKIRLHSIGNDKNFNYYIFDKKEEVISKLSPLFYQIFSLTWDSYDESTDKKGKWVKKKRAFESYKDKHEALRSVGNPSRIDIFYGDKKIFVSINCPQKLRLKFNEALFEIASMPKSK